MTDFELIKVPGRFVVTKNPLFANTVSASQGTMEKIRGASKKSSPDVSIIESMEVVAFPPEASVKDSARPIRVPNFPRLEVSSSILNSTSMQKPVGDPIKAYSVASADNVSDSALSISTSEENNNPFLPENSDVDRGFNVALFENQNDIPVVNPADAMDFSSSYPDEIGDEEVNMSSFDEDSNDIPVANSADGVMDFSSSDIPEVNSADEVMDFQPSYPDEDTISVRFKGLSDGMGASVTGGVERALNELIVSTRLSDSVATENPITSDADRSVGVADRDTVLVAPDVERVEGDQQKDIANVSGAVVLDFASLRTDLKEAQVALQESRETLKKARNARNNQRRVYEQSLGVAARRLEAMKRETLKNQKAAEECREEAEKFTTGVDQLDAMFYEPSDFVDMNGGHSYSKAA